MIQSNRIAIGSLATVAILLLFSTAVQAQTPAIGTENLTWDQDASSLAAAQAQAYDMKDGAAAAVALSPVVCTGTAAPFLCKVRLPALTTGLHASLTVTAKITVSGQVLSSAPSLPLSLLIIAVPAVPQNVRVT